MTKLVTLSCLRQQTIGNQNEFLLNISIVLVLRWTRTVTNFESVRRQIHIEYQYTQKPLESKIQIHHLICAYLNNLYSA